MNDETYLDNKSAYKFYFQEGDNQIACHGSYFTGKEEIYLNDDLVSSKRNFGFKGVHQFDIKGDQYSVIYELSNLLSGKITCTFMKGRKSIAVQSQSLFSKDPKMATAIMLLCFIAGFTCAGLGYAFGHFLFGLK